ncbi:MAG: transporter substrate-binding domain-containing protein, partial [Alistipes sp.]|nr:transporter substrate-binding domain-containing protein [Alistipes sp.]
MQADRTWGSQIKRITLSWIVVWMVACMGFMQEAVGATSPKVKVLGDRFFPPYEFINEEGKPEGFNVELLEAVMKSVNLEYELQLGSWPEAMQQVQTHQGDMLTGLIYGAHRDHSFLFSSPYSYIYLHVVVRKESPIRTWQDLQGKEVLCQTGDIVNDLLRERGFTEDQQIRVDNVVDALRLLSQGAHDAAIFNGQQARYVIRNYHLKNLEVIPLNVNPMPYSFATYQGNDSLLQTLNRGLTIVRGNGEYDRIYNKWFGTLNSSNVALWLYWVGGGIGVLLLLALLFIVVLRRQIARATQTLEQSRRELSLALHAGDVSVWRYDFDSDRFVALQGDILLHDGKSMEEFCAHMYKEDRLLFENVIQRLKEGAGHETLSIRYQDKETKGCRYIRKEIIPLRNEEGRLVALIGTHKDCTEQMLAAQRMEEAMTKYSTVFHAASIGLEYYDQNGILIDINDTALHLYGLPSREKVLNHHLALEQDPNYTGRVNLAELTHEIKYSFEYDFDLWHTVKGCENLSCKEGECRMENRITPLFHDGKLTGVIITSQDITENYRYQCELELLSAQLKMVLESGQIQGWIYDPNTHTFQTIGQHKGGSFSSAESHFCSIPTEDREVLEALMSDLLEGRRSKGVITVRHYIDGMVRYCQAHMLPVWEDGKITKLTGTYREVTESVRQQQQIEEVRNNLLFALQAGKLISWIYRPKEQRFYILGGEGAKQSQISLMEMYIAMPVEDAAKHLQCLNEIEEGKKETESLILRYHKGDAYQYCEISLMAVQRDGRLSHIVGVQRDITRNYQYRRSLEENQLKIDLAIRSGDLVLWDYDCTSHLYTTKYDPLIPDGEPCALDRYIAFTHPDDVAILKEMNALMNEGCDEEFCREFRLKLQGIAAWQYMVLTGTPLERDGQGRVIRYTGLRRNDTRWRQITLELEESKKKMDLALKHDRSLLWEYDCETRLFITASKDSEYRDQAVTEEQYLQFVHPEDVPAFAKVADVMHRRENLPMEVEGRIRLHADDPWMYVSITGIPFAYDDQGRVCRYIGIRKDNTSWKKLT